MSHRRPYTELLRVSLHDVVDSATTATVTDHCVYFHLKIIKIPANKCYCVATKLVSRAIVYAGAGPTAL